MGIFVRQEKIQGGNAYQTNADTLFVCNTYLLLLVTVGHTRPGGTAAAGLSSRTTPSSSRPTGSFPRFSPLQTTRMCPILFRKKLSMYETDAAGLLSSK